MNGGDRLSGQQHNDILSINPSSSEEKNKIIEELKRRANAAFKVGSLREAEVLYSRGIELNSDDQDVHKALLSNRSMAFTKMGMFSEALKDAEQLLKIDSNFAKGFYRKGVALRGLKRFSEAVKSFDDAIKVEPNNKSLSEEIEKTKKDEEKYLKDQEVLKSQKAKLDLEAATEAENEAKKVIKTVIVENGEPTAQNEAKPSKNKSNDEVDLSLRGYRTTKDGRKTTFFNMERTEEELKLLQQRAESKPQKIIDEPVETAEQKGARNMKVNGGSVWNEKGTFEETDYNSWARKNFDEIFKDKSFQVDNFNIEIKICEIKDLEGDASITFTRGKKRKIFDFSFILLLEIEFESEKIEAEMFVPEFSGDQFSSIDFEKAEKNSDICLKVSNEVEMELRWGTSSRKKAAEKYFEDRILKQLNVPGSEFRKQLAGELFTWTKNFMTL